MGTLILPACGNSTRFPDTRPKFLLTHPNGKIMIRAGIDGLDLSTTEKIIVTVRHDHLEKYNFKELISKQFSNLPFELCVLNRETKGQAETVFETIQQKNIKGSFQIKDCDNYFESNIPNNNFVAISDLHHHSSINPSNKSYIKKSNNGYIDNIIEKKIISSYFCCGLYGFKSTNDFVYTFQQLPKDSYISHIINKLKFDFVTITITNYVDWGTYQDWNNYISQFETLFIDLDGVLVENSDETGWGKKPSIINNVDFLNNKRKNGKTYIIITTSRMKEYQDITEKQLKEYNIPYDIIIYGLPHSCKRTIINDYSNTNKYPSCQAINLPRNMGILSELMN